MQFKIKDEHIFEFLDPRHALVCRISANELVNLYRRYSLGLFAQNIRLPMLAGKNPINAQIASTAASDGEHFFFFNNGVSAVCADFDREGNQITARRFQIINGAQTVGSLTRASSRTGVFVLFRLTATDEELGGAFTESVIRFNNTQNPVKDPDFRANDPIQQFLQRNLQKFSGKGPVPAFYYQAKRGFKPKGRAGKALRREDFANLRHAFLYGPVTSFKEPKTLWDNLQGGKYWEAFGVDGKAVEVWSDEVMAEAVVAFVITDRLQKTHDELRRNQRDLPPEKRAIELLYLKRLARYVGALVGVGLRTRKDDAFHSYVELLSTKAKFEEVVAPLEKAARTLVLDEFTARQQKKDEVRTEYNFARSQDVWESVRDKLVSRTLSDLI